MLCFVFSILVVLLDQFFKRWIVLTHDVGQETQIIPGFLSLFHLENTGAAFNILADQRWLLAGIQLVAALVLIAILLRYTDGFWGTLGLAAVLGGTAGNLIDRVFHGHVVDMFRFLFIDFAVFNVADVFITLGFITFLAHFIASSFRPSKNRDVLPVPASADIAASSHIPSEYPTDAAESDLGIIEDTIEDTNAVPFVPNDAHATFFEAPQTEFAPQIQYENGQIIEHEPPSIGVIEPTIAGDAPKQLGFLSTLDPIEPPTVDDTLRELDAFSALDLGNPPVVDDTLRELDAFSALDLGNPPVVDDTLRELDAFSALDLGNPPVVDDTQRELDALATLDLNEPTIASEATSKLDVLSALESELLSSDDTEDYDVDKLLSDYGFESNE